MQHPTEAGRLRLVLLNMERGHTAKVSDWLLMLLSRLGLVELTQPDITLSGLNPFELRQSREAQISKHIHTSAYTLSGTHPRIKRKYCLQLNMHLYMIIPQAFQHRVCIYKPGSR